MNAKRKCEITNRLIGVCLFTFLGFLLWLYLASNHSTVDDWWTVKKTTKITSINQDITMVITPEHHVVSPMRVLIGLSVFILLGFLLSFIVKERTE
ncbi:hypothetical protein [Oceanobacillus sp. CAU 1775]